MQYLYDANGKEYLDCFGGIVTVSVGHCHPYVVEAIEKQLRQIWHTTVIYMNPTLTLYSQKLTSKLPGDLKVFSYSVIYLFRFQIKEQIILPVS